MAPAAGTLTQDGRPIVLTTPLGKDKLLALAVSAREALSELFSVEVHAFAPAAEPLDFSKLLGQACSVRISPAEKGGQRFFHGICSRVEEGERNSEYVEYMLTLVPQLWLLTRVTQSRTFQHATVTDILKKVLTGIDVKLEVQGTFKPRDYCAQYRETDFEFASRLMEEEGIWYFFVHTTDKHQMVLANAPASHQDLPGSAAIQFEEDTGGVREPDRVHSWSKVQELRSGKTTLWDHCFELPGKHLEADKAVQPSAAVGKATHKLAVGGNDKLELYDYPGGYAQRFDGIDKGGGDRAADIQGIFEDNKRTAEIRMQAETSAALKITGAGTSVRMCAGYAFQLARHPGDADGKYVLSRVVHRASGGGNYASSSREPFAHTCDFECFPAAVPYRPPRVTPRPFVRGSQTAIVVGPSGEEIFTDKYSRVKVQFHWDRAGKNDTDSSCWVRVATTWAGKNWGAIHIPRIGQEVVVDFLEGDPDQPIIVGSVYNAEQMPPYALPDNKTQSGIKSRSTAKGTTDHFNEIRFEDKKGDEQIYVHAQKDYMRVVENLDVQEIGLAAKSKESQKITIHGHRTEIVKEGDETITIEKGARLVTIKVGSETLMVEKGARLVTVKEGTETLVVEKGARTVTVSKGDDLHEVLAGGRTVKIEKDDTLTVASGAQKIAVSKGGYELKVADGHVVNVDKGGSKLTVATGDIDMKADAGKTAVEAATSIEFKCGGSSIKIEPAGITIKGAKISISGDATVDVKSPMTTVKGDGMLTLKGGITMIN